MKKTIYWLFVCLLILPLGLLFAILCRLFEGVYDISYEISKLFEKSVDAMSLVGYKTHDWAYKES